MPTIAVILEESASGGSPARHQSEDTTKLSGTTVPRKRFLTPRRIGLLVEGYPGQRECKELSRLSDAGQLPRVHYVEVARAVDGEVIDGPYMAAHANLLLRLAMRLFGYPLAEVGHTFLHRRRYSTLCAWSDRLGLPLALLYKLARSRGDLVLVSQWPSRPKKAIFLRHLRVHTHLRAMLNSSTYQLDYACRQLGVPGKKLQVAYRPVDDRFWAPTPPSQDNRICAVGWEARDYDTLMRAVQDLDVHVTIAVGMIGMAVASVPSVSSHVASDRLQSDPTRLGVLAPWKQTYGYALQEGWLAKVQQGGAPSNVTILYQLVAQELRELYHGSRFVVVPLYDVDSNCGVTTVTEAMAMGRAVIVTRIRGQRDVIVDGEQGLYVPPRNPAALRAAILHLLAHPEEAARMGRAGRALVEERHTMDAYVAQLAALLSGEQGAGRPTAEWMGKSE